MVLVTACRAANPREGIDFLPLTVDYREYTYASGRIPGGFFKREGKPSEKEVLTSRMIDRPIRPLFPSGWRFETQIIALVLSADAENDTDVLAITGASAALALSDIPFQKTIAGVRVGLVDGQYVINPTFEQRKVSKLDIIVAGSKDGMVMVEAGAKEVTEEQVVEALEAAHAAIKQIVAAIDEMAKEVGRKKRTVDAKEVDADVPKDVEGKVLDKLTDAMRIHDKLENYETRRQGARRLELLASFGERVPRKRPTPSRSSSTSRKRSSTARSSPTTCGSTAASWTKCARSGSRPACCPRTHGSAVFTRGETQALVTCTLGTADDAQKIETFEGETWKNFMLHYNFPPFSVGEVGRHVRAGPPRSGPRRPRGARGCAA